MRQLRFKPMGVIHTAFDRATGTPIQPSRPGGARATVEVYPEYVDGLKDLDGFERIWLIYWFDRAPGSRLRVVPFLDNRERGIFATRAPTRPCPIGMSAVRLLAISGNHLHVEDADILDGTPLLDIKPYVPEFDAYAVQRSGWFERAGARKFADERFSSREPKRRML
ncbi:MAG: tRNA (N6-threonylcarbamoyladenosine(37)-N6)-methyltransferase TrmO [Bryobacteraceae bacterium]